MVACLRHVRLELQSLALVVLEQLAVQHVPRPATVAHPVVDLARAEGVEPADRLELAHVQIHGWARRNRDAVALRMGAAQLERAQDLSRELFDRLGEASSR